jgi:hypothetical protein
LISSSSFEAKLPASALQKHGKNALVSRTKTVRFLHCKEKIKTTEKPITLTLNTVILHIDFT